MSERQNQNHNPILDLAGPGLDPLIADAHSGRVRLIGAVDVTHGGLAAGILARLAGLPEAGSAVPFSAVGEHKTDRVTWQRNFDGHHMDSTFRRNGELLEERRGPLSILLEARAADGALTLKSVETRLWGRKLPDWLTLQIAGEEQAKDGKYRFRVEIANPVIGRLVTYAGILELEHL
jgi:hypothetical protein